MRTQTTRTLLVVRRTLVLLGLAGALVTSPAAYAQSCDPDPEAACENPGARPLLASLSLTRSPGPPNSATGGFTSTTGWCSKVG
jgi:hypothetical protein